MVSSTLLFRWFHLSSVKAYGVISFLKVSIIVVIFLTLIFYRIFIFLSLLSLLLIPLPLGRVASPLPKTRKAIPVSKEVYRLYRKSGPLFVGQYLKITAFKFI